MNVPLYLVLQRGPRQWSGIRIVKVSRKKPVMEKPSEQALVRLLINVPDNVLEPREVRVEVKPEHIVAPVVTVVSEKP